MRDARGVLLPCVWCGGPMGREKRGHARTCGKRCRQALYRSGEGSLSWEARQRIRDVETIAQGHPGPELDAALERDAIEPSWGWPGRRDLGRDTSAGESVAAGIAPAGRA